MNPSRRQALQLLTLPAVSWTAMTTAACAAAGTQVPLPSGSGARAVDAPAVCSE
ncbi:MAG TPA: hypothetical protein VGC54_12635 [Planctomycetota bacterium]